jgi:uncharacterized protein (DUF1778 family)
MRYHSMLAILLLTQSTWAGKGNPKKHSSNEQQTGAQVSSVIEKKDTEQKSSGSTLIDDAHKEEGNFRDPEAERTKGDTMIDLLNAFEDFFSTEGAADREERVVQFMRSSIVKQARKILKNTDPRFIPHLEASERILQNLLELDEPQKNLQENLEESLILPSKGNIEKVVQLFENVFPNRYAKKNPIRLTKRYLKAIEKKDLDKIRRSSAAINRTLDKWEGKKIERSATPDQDNEIFSPRTRRLQKKILEQAHLMKEKIKRVEKIFEKLN